MTEFLFLKSQDLKLAVVSFVVENTYASFLCLEATCY